MSRGTKEEEEEKEEAMKIDVRGQDCADTKRLEQT